jgi:prolyl 4-hydroxylase
MHHAKVSTNYPWLPHNLDPTLPVPKQYKNMPINPLGDRQAAYDAYIKGCRDANPGSRGNRCLSTEEDRIEMSLRQPQSMQNYTEIGFKKIRAPEALFALIKDFWDKNHKNGKEEQWGSANTYTNNWEFSSEMVSVEDSGLRGGGSVLKQRIWDSARDVRRSFHFHVLLRLSDWRIISPNSFAELSRLSVNGREKN